MTRHIHRRDFFKSAAAGVSLSALPPVWAQANKYDVIVVGAGLSGLHTAFLLEQHGLNVLVLESSDRVGGRVYTLDHLDGHPEAGAMQVGVNYHRLRAAMTRLNLPLISESGARTNGAISVRGQLLHPQDWQNHPANVLPENERHVQPGYLLWKYLTAAIPFTDPANWLQDQYRSFDVPLDEFLRSQGAGAEALRLINSNFESNALNEVSALHTLRKLSVILQSGGAEFVQNGTSRIPEAMVSSLKTAPFLNKAVTSVKYQNDMVVVSCADGSTHSAHRCVLAAPFSTVRKMDLQIDMRDLKRQAINDLDYSHITQVFLKPTSDFWEEDGFRPDMWTDSPIGMISTEADGDKKVSLLRVWLIGNNAKALNGLSKSEIGEAVIKNLESLRPSTKNKLSMAEVVSWGTNPNNLGAYAHFRPGDVGRFAQVVAEPEGPLHFVGEHTEFQKSGMEAAILSAERCAKQLVDSLS